MKTNSNASLVVTVAHVALYLGVAVSFMGAAFAQSTTTATTTNPSSNTTATTNPPKKIVVPAPRITAPPTTTSSVARIAPQPICKKGTHYDVPAHICKLNSIPDAWSTK